MIQCKIYETLCKIGIDIYFSILFENLQFKAQFPSQPPNIIYVSSSSVSCHGVPCHDLSCHDDPYHDVSCRLFALPRPPGC